MNIRLISTMMCFCFLVFMNCFSQQERKVKNKLIPIEAQRPERLPTDLPNFLHLIVDKDGKCFYYLGGQQTRTSIDLADVDTLVLRHKQVKDAVFIIIPCGNPVHNNVEILMTKLDDLAVKEYRVGDCL